MEPIHNQQMSHVTDRKSFSYLEEIDRLLHHVEAARKTSVRMTTTTRQIEATLGEINAAQSDRAVIKQEIELSVFWMSLMSQ